jgi:hypothetical protein
MNYDERMQEAAQIIEKMRMGDAGPKHVTSYQLRRAEETLKGIETFAHHAGLTLLREYAVSNRNRIRSILQGRDSLMRKRYD